MTGRSIDGDDEPAPSVKKKSNEPTGRGAFQATCTRNSECDSNTCFVGRGNLGFEDSDEDCTGKLLGRLGSLEDALGDAQARTGRSEVDAAIARAVDAQKVIQGKCSKRAVKKWSKPMDRVVARLQGASRYL